MLVIKQFGPITYAMGTLQEILAGTGIAAKVRALPNDVAGCTLEMGADGLWTGNLGTLTQAQADAIKAEQGVRATLKVGVPAQVDGGPATWCGEGLGWVAEEVSPLWNAMNADASIREGFSAFVRYTDGTEVNEPWANLSAWSVGTPGVQVSGGKLYSNSASGGPNCWAYKAISGIRYAASLICVPDATVGAYVFFGVSTISSPAGLANCFGLALNGTTLYTVKNGVLASVPNYLVSINTGYYVDIASDNGSDFSFQITSSTTKLSYSFKITVSPIGVVVFNSDKRTTSGGYIGAIDVKTSYSSMRSSVVGPHKSAISKTLLAANAKIIFPANFDSRKPYPICIMFHGNGTSEQSWDTYPVQDPRYPVAVDYLMSAGYVVLTATAISSNMTWGSQDSINAYSEAFLWASKLFQVSKVVAFCNSMGGIESLNLLSRKLAPISRLFMAAPTFNLRECYDNALFTSTITAAYGISGDGSDYANKTSGYDPNLYQINAFSQSKYYLLIPSDDAAITPNANGIALHDKLISYKIPSTIEIVTGGHGFAITSTQWNSMVSFFAS